MTIHNWRLVPPAPGVRFTPKGGSECDLEIPEEHLALVVEWLGNNYRALYQGVYGELPPGDTGAEAGAVEGQEGQEAQSPRPLPIKAPPAPPAQTFNPGMFANAPMQPPPLGHGFAGAPPAAPAAQTQAQFSPFAIQPPAAAGGAAGFLASQPPIAPPPPPHGTAAAPAHPMQTAGGFAILPQPAVARPPRPLPVTDAEASLVRGARPGRLGARSAADIQAQAAQAQSAQTAQERSLAALPQPVPPAGGSAASQGTFGAPASNVVPVHTGPAPSNGIELVQIGTDHLGRPVFEGQASGEPIAVLPQPAILAPPPPPAGPPPAPEEFIPVRGADLGGCRGCNGHGVRFNARDFGRDRPLKCVDCNGSGGAVAPPASSAVNGHVKSLDSGGAGQPATDESTPPAQ